MLNYETELQIMIITDNTVTESCNQELCAVLCAAAGVIRGQRWMIADKCTSMWKTTWTFITRSLFEPVRKSWTIV